MKKDDIFKIYSSMCEVRIYGEGGLVPFGKIPRWHYRRIMGILERELNIKNKHSRRFKTGTD